MIERALQDILTNPALCPTVAATIGPRAYQDELPQSPQFPAIVYTVVFETSDYHMEGSNRLLRARVQISCMAERKKDANTLADAVVVEVGGFKGEVGGSPSVLVQGIFHEGGNADTAEEMLNAGPRIALKRVDVQCFFTG